MDDILEMDLNIISFTEVSGLQDLSKGRWEGERAHL